MDSAIPQPHDVDSWRVIRILSEFVEGFETMESLGPAVVIFGSTLIKPGDPYYEITTQLAEKIVKKNLGIITGGGSGLMEAANKGATLAHGKSCGICIDLPQEELPNKYINNRYLLSFRYFFVRKVMFTRYAQAFIAMPGGLGTLDELFEVLTLISTRKIQPFPVFLVGTHYWSGLIDWIKNTIVAAGNLPESCFKIFTVTDDLDHIANEIEAYCQRMKNFRNF
jgi:uncharacterized protein (TIGR00730 family)